MIAAHPQLLNDFKSLSLVLTRTNSPHLIGALIDHTLLKPDYNSAGLEKLCNEAGTFSFRSVCVPPAAVQFTNTTLAKLGFSNVGICTVVGFPLGYQTTQTKTFETQLAVEQGATEIDFVMNAAWAKEKNWQSLEIEATQILLAAQGCLVKIILETSQLTPQEIDECTFRHAVAGVPVIKTSTGFGSRGATQDDLKTIQNALKRATIATGKSFGIKASGGIRTGADALLFCKLGATRLGTSNGVVIVQKYQNDAKLEQY